MDWMVSDKCRKKAVSQFVRLSALCSLWGARPPPRKKFALPKRLFSNSRVGLAPKPFGGPQPFASRLRKVQARCLESIPRVQSLEH